MSKEKKQQILKTAAKRFIRHGLNKTTLAEIARDLRIGKATLYNYFVSKEELFYETINWECGLLLDEVSKIFGDEVTGFPEKLGLYFGIKEGIDKKYLLVYEMILLLFQDDDRDKEKNILSDLIKKEEEIIKKALGKQIKNTTSDIPLFIVTQSWGYFFEGKITSISHPSIEIKSKEKLIKNILLLIE